MGHNVSERIKAVSKMVTPCGTAADIGCDHCFTLIYLVNKGVIKRGIGCDIKEGPLAKAADNLKKYGVSHVIELRVGSGLNPIKGDKAEAIVISGMGGRLVNHILNENIQTAAKANELILQPQRDIQDVRRGLHKMGFKITDENMVIERGKFYTIIKAQKGTGSYKSEAEYLYGKILIDSGNPVLKQYLSMMYSNNENLMCKLKGLKTEKSAERVNKAEKDNRLIGEVLKCL